MVSFGQKRNMYVLQHPDTHVIVNGEASNVSP
jgi:hypothetical protein